MANPSKVWSLKELPAYASRSPEEIRVLWAADLPRDRDTNPALWDTLLGFFEDAAVAYSERPGTLVTTPRALLRSLKEAGREPSAGRAVIEELFRRGDILRADKLTLAAATSTSSAPSIRSTLAQYIWGLPKVEPPGLDDPIVPTAALASVSARSKASLSGPVSSDDVHTVSSIASEVTGRSIRDAEAVIAHLVSQKAASVIHAESTADSKTPIVGVKFGTSPPTDADKGILQTKAALQRMEDLIEHLEESVQQETTAAASAARAGNKSDALARLRKKKLLDNKLTGARASAHKLTDILMAVDEAASNKEAVQALEVGMESLRAATADGITASRIDAIASDYAEAAAEQEDVRVALQQLNDTAEGSYDYAAEEAELNAMLAAEDAGHKLQVPDSASLAAAEEEELNKIMAELGIEKGDTATLPVPPSPEGKLPVSQPGAATSRAKPAAS